jgi:hypothetical protein
MAPSHAFSIGLMCIPPNLRPPRALSTPRFALAPSPASDILSTFPVPLSRPQGPQLVCCPGIHATLHVQTCLFCYRTICKKDTQTFYATARLGVAMSQQSSRSERNTFHLGPRRTWARASAEAASWRRNHGLSQAGVRTERA